MVSGGLEPLLLAALHPPEDVELLSREATKGGGLAHGLQRGDRSVTLREARHDVRDPIRLSGQTVVS